MPLRRSSSSSTPGAQNRVHAAPLRTLSPAAKARRRALRRRRQAIIAGGVALLLLAMGGAFALKNRMAPNARALAGAFDPATLVTTQKNPAVEECDVAVLGGTPSGIAAALAAARAGAKVVLVEPRPLLGGDWTYAWINQFDVPIKGLHSLHSPVDYGIFGEFYKELGLAFAPERARELAERKLRAEPTSAF